MTFTFSINYVPDIFDLLVLLALIGSVIGVVLAGRKWIFNIGLTIGTLFLIGFIIARLYPAIIIAIANVSIAIAFWLIVITNGVEARTRRIGALLFIVLTVVYWVTEVIGVWSGMMEDGSMVYYLLSFAFVTSIVLTGFNADRDNRIVVIALGVIWLAHMESYIILLYVGFLTLTWMTAAPLILFFALIAFSVMNMKTTRTIIGIIMIVGAAIMGVLFAVSSIFYQI